MNILVVVDMQNDFIDGALGTKEAVAIVDNVVNKIENFDGMVLATRDTHKENYMETQEGKNLPVVHCIEGTFGWEIADKVSSALEKKSAKIFDKPTFGSAALAEYLGGIKDPIESITFIGLCTGICVISNAMITKAYLPEVPLKVSASCCACVTPDSHNTALEAMKLCQIEIEE